MKISIYSQRRKKAVVVKAGAADVAGTYATQISQVAAHVREKRLRYAANFAKDGDVVREPEHGILAG